MCFQSVAAGMLSHEWRIWSLHGVGRCAVPDKELHPEVWRSWRRMSDICLAILSGYNTCRVSDYCLNEA